MMKTKTCYQIAFDSVCSSCAAIAMAIVTESEGLITPVPLQSTTIKDALMQARTPDRQLAEPALVCLRDTGVSIYTGLPMAIRLGLLLGPNRGLRILRFIQGQGVRFQWHDDVLTVVKGENRREFIKASVRVMLGVSVAPSLLKSKKLSLALPNGKIVQATATPLASLEVQGMVSRHFMSGDGLALLQYFEALGYTMQRDKAAAINFVNTGSRSGTVNMYIPLQGWQSLPVVRLKVSQDSSGTTYGGVRVVQTQYALHLDGYQVVHGTVQHVLNTDIPLTSTHHLLRPNTNSLDGRDAHRVDQPSATRLENLVLCGVCVSVATAISFLGCNWFTDVTCTVVCAGLSLLVGSVECALVCYLLTQWICKNGSIGAGVSAIACGEVGLCP